MNKSITYILKTRHPAQTGKDNSLNMCIDFMEVRTPSLVSSGEQPERSPQEHQREQLERAGATQIKKQ